MAYTKDEYELMNDVERKKELSFKKKTFGVVKNLLTYTPINGISITKNFSDITKLLHEQGFADSLNEAEEQINEYLSGEEMHLSHIPGSMKFKEAGYNDKGEKRIKISYWEWDI